MTWRIENSCPHRDSNSDPLVVHHVASRYTDCAIPAPFSGNGSVNEFPLQRIRTQHYSYNRNGVFSMWFVPKCYKQGQSSTGVETHLETASNTSTVALRDVGGDERGTHSHSFIPPSTNSGTESG
jgi:hypothetical protein